MMNRMKIHLNQWQEKIVNNKFLQFVSVISVGAWLIRMSVKILIWIVNMIYCNHDILIAFFNTLEKIVKILPYFDTCLFKY